MAKDYYETLGVDKGATREDIKKYVQTYIKERPKVVGLLLSPAMKEQMKVESLEQYLNNK